MKRVMAISAGAIAAAALAAGCGSSGGSNGSSGGSGGGGSSASSSATGLHVQSTKYGQILVDGSGRTLYMLSADSGGKSSCYGTCASIWPPDTTTGGSPASSGVTASMVSTSARTDHTTQVTVNGHPLYTFAKDAKSGDVNGEGVATFGGTWYVVGADGNPVTSAPAGQAPSTSGGGGGGNGY